MTYQGLDAPTDLFADLALIGWVPPTIAPPPHDAIDWSRPNEATGERFTLRDYTVEAAVVTAPVGSGQRGTWSPTERTAHLAALRRVFDRHPAVVVADPDGLTLPLLPPPPGPVETDALPGDPAPASTGAVAFVPATGTTAVLVTAPVKPSLAPVLEDELTALGVTVVFDNQERVREERYRGSTYQTTFTQLHVAVVAAPTELDAVVATLSRHGLPLTFAEVDDDVVAEPAPEVAAPAGRDGSVQIVALADPRREPAVREVLETLAIAEVRVTRSSRTEVMRYRGSLAERQVPAIRVEVGVPEQQAGPVAAQIAGAAHLDVADTDRIWIVGPRADGPHADAPTTHRLEEAAGIASGPPPPPAPGGASGLRLDPGALIRRATPTFADGDRSVRMA